MHQNAPGARALTRLAMIVVVVAALSSVGWVRLVGPASMSAAALAPAATTWTVTSSDDVAAGDGCDDPAAAGTLRWAVQQFQAVAQTTPGSYVIDIQTNAPIVLTAACSLYITPPPDGQTVLTLQGQGSGTTAIDASAADGFGLYSGSQPPSGAVTVAGLSVTGDRLGFETFGAPLTMRDVAVADVSGQFADQFGTTGIQLGASPDVTIEDSSFTTHANDLAFSGGWPAYGAGTVTITNTTFTVVAGSALSDSGCGVRLGGGAAYTLDHVTATNQITDATDTFFSVGSSGIDAASVRVVHTTVDSASGFITGGIGGDLTITDSSFTNPNLAHEPYLAPFQIACTAGGDCHLLMNRSFVDSGLSSHTGTVFYGFLESTDSAPLAIVENSTFRLTRLSSADGPIGVYGYAATTSASASPTVVLRNNTVMGDSVNLLSGGWADTDGTFSATAELDDNVVDSGACSPVQSHSPVASTAITGEGNVITSNDLTGGSYCHAQIALTAGLFTVLDVPSMLLGPLADNGGESLSYKPQPGSPLIDGGVLPPNTDSPFLAGDQRVLDRIQGGVIDVGAVEIQGGVVQFDSDVTVDADADIVFTLTRTNGSEGPLSVVVTTSDGTAEAGVNYTPTTATVTWADGDSATKTVTVPVMLVEDGRTVAFTATLSVPLGQSASAGTKATAVGTIVDPAVPAVVTTPGTDSPAGALARTGTDVLPLLLLTAVLLAAGTTLQRASSFRGDRRP